MDTDKEYNTEGPSSGISYDDIFEMLMESQFWPPEVMQAYQRTQLEQLLRHARANVPFYEKRLNCVFNRDDSINWSNWAEIPIVTREDLRDRRDEMQARVQPSGHGRVMTASSSGSTGVPITVSFPEIALTVGRAAWQRMYQAHGFDKLKNHCEFKFAAPDGTPLAPEPLEIQAPNSDRKMIYIERGALPERKLAMLKRCKVNLLADTPNSLEILARVNLLQVEQFKLEGVTGIGMALSPTQRKLISESFGARCASPYSSKEGSLIAAECPETNWYHVTAEALLFEGLDGDGKPVGPGAKGRSIITPFFYSAQPLIRYDQGDIVVPGASCPCGCTLPTLRSIEGRSDPIFRLGGRETAITGLDFEALRQDLNAIATQIAQTGASSLEVRYVASEDASDTGITAYIRRVQSCVGPEVDFTFKRVDKIPANSGGKQQRMVREYQPNS